MFGLHQPPFRCLINPDSESLEPKQLVPFRVERSGPCDERMKKPRRAEHASTGQGLRNPGLPCPSRASQRLSNVISSDRVLSRHEKRKIDDFENLTFFDEAFRIGSSILGPLSIAGGRSAIVACYDARKEVGQGFQPDGAGESDWKA
jgi:hypothetical protein